MVRLVSGSREKQEVEVEIRYGGKKQSKKRRIRYGGKKQSKKRTKRMSCVKNNLIRLLPEEITLNIISRLPVDSVLECRRVSKSWRNLLPLRHDNNTYFADIHLRHQPQQRRHHQHNKNCNTDSCIDTKLNFVFLGHESLYCVEYDENVVNSNHTRKKITLSLPPGEKTLVGSCNGLICLAVPLPNRSCSYEPVYICNPITREFVHLPRFIMSKKHKRSHIAHGFGYHPTTNEYKVVRVIYNRGYQRHSVGQVQVYTLGSGIGWRNKGEIAHIFFHRISSGAVLFDGALHWISTEGNIVAFDLEDEEFHCLPVIPGSSSPWCYHSKLWMLGGWLWVVHEKTKTNVEIWLLRKKEDRQGTSSNDQCWSWSREFTKSIEDISHPLMYQPSHITKRGEILQWCDGEFIVCWSPKPAAIPKKHVNLDEAIYGLQAISHSNSFVSLKALGEISEIL